MNFPILKKLMEQNRSTRIFDENRRISPDSLRELIDLTRLCPSGRNLQPLRYRIAVTPEECAAIFPALKWAGYYTDWEGPEPGQRPAAYLIQCLDTALTPSCLCDDGLQLEAITLGAVALDLRCCIIKAFNPQLVTEALRLPAEMTPLYIVALGYGAEKTAIVPLGEDGDIRYFRTPDGTHCVPKRDLDDLIIK